MTSYFQEGKLVGLRAFREEDLETNWHNWFNDPDITKNLATGSVPNSREHQRQFFNDIVLKSKDRVIFAVEDKRTQKLIGVCSISGIDSIHRRGYMAAIIGEKEFHRGGYSLEVYYLIVKHAFAMLNLNKVKTGTTEENTISLKNLELIGFHHIGTAHEEIYKNGRYVNCVYSEILKKDWEKIDG